MVVVPLLSALGVRGKKSHATALMVIVPLSLVSAILYLVQGRVTVMDALPWLPGSLLSLPWQPPDAENLHRLA